MFGMRETGRFRRNVAEGQTFLSRPETASLSG